MFIPAPRIAFSDARARPERRKCVASYHSRPMRPGDRWARPTKSQWVWCATLLPKHNRPRPRSCSPQPLQPFLASDPHTRAHKPSDVSVSFRPSQMFGFLIDNHGDTRRWAITGARSRGHEARSRGHAQITGAGREHGDTRRLVRLFDFELGLLVLIGWGD